MNQLLLRDTAAKLVKSPKGILAIDESFTTCNKRFEKLGIPETEEKRREYRELLITAPGIEEYISGYITFDETIRQADKNGKLFRDILKEKGIEVGIKVDGGTEDFKGIEKVTKGLEGLQDRLKEYRTMGASFAKWRAVYTVGEDTPTYEAMKENAKSLAQYAFWCQENDIVPMVEPEVLLDGAHTIERCFEVTAKNLDIVFDELKALGVYMPGVILKTSMVLPGSDSAPKAKELVAEMTIKCLKGHVPSDIGGIVFLSGGQSDEEAVLNLNEMHKGGELPWPLSFSYGRAIQNEALKAWATNPTDVIGAQKLLVAAARNNSLASLGQYE